MWRIPKQNGSPGSSTATLRKAISLQLRLIRPTRVRCCYSQRRSLSHSLGPGQRGPSPPGVSVESDVQLTGLVQTTWGVQQRNTVQADHWKPPVFVLMTRPPDLLLTWTLLYMLSHPTSSFEAVILSMATRGHCLTWEVNMGHNKLLAARLLSYLANGSYS